MKRMLITLTPMEPYFLGGEKIFPFGNRESVKAPYFIRSLSEPSQSTLLGVIRYALLERAGLIRANFEYTPEETREIQAMVGKSSFEIGSAERYQKIIGIGPLFWLDKQGKEHIRLPMNHKNGEASYTPMRPPDETNRKQVLASFPEIAVSPEEYDVKKGLAEGFLRLDDGAVIPNDTVFAKEVVRVGIRKRTNSSETLEEGFFKRVYYHLNTAEGWRFAFHLLVDDDVSIDKPSLVHLGQKKSMFRMRCESSEEISEGIAGQPLINDVEKMAYTGNRAYVALSDCYTAKPLSKTCRCAITSTRTFRSLVTKYRPEDGKFYSKLSRTPDVVRVYKAGSIFFPEEKEKEFLESFADEEACFAIGMNHLVCIGGKRNERVSV